MGEEVRTSSDLIRWLKLLALPAWAKLGLALIMLLALSNAMALLVNGVMQKDQEAIAAAVSIFTVVLPISLIVVALVFGDGGVRKLRQMTQQVLDKDIPQAVRENLANDPHFSQAELTIKHRGYISDYALTFPRQELCLNFRIELNVRKANVVFWLNIPGPPESDARTRLAVNSAFHSCLVGAVNEGYALNPVVQEAAGSPVSGFVFIKSLEDDFLLEPGQRLYFAQDLSFFVRGMLEAVAHHG